MFQGTEVTDFVKKHPRNSGTLLSEKSICVDTLRKFKSVIRTNLFFRGHKQGTQEPQCDPLLNTSKGSISLFSLIFL